MRISTLQLLGVLVPTAAAFLFETGLMLWSGDGLNWRVVVGRTALMALAALVFSGFMFRMIQDKHRAVLAERKRLEAMFQSSSEAILLVDGARRVRAMNLAAEHMLGGGHLGFHLCRLCNLSPPTVTEPGQCSNRGCNFELSRDTPFFESVIRRADGAIIPVAVSKSVLPAADGMEAQAMIGLRDISERRALERVRVSHLIAARTLEAQEEERRRIARELHDGIGQDLYGLRLCAQVGQPVETQIVAVMEEVQRLATSLYPPVLEKLGLVAALRSHSDRLWGGQGTLEVAEDFPRLSRAAEAAVYRLVQEALGNALRHGGASGVAVRLLREGDEVRIEVEDDGSGFDPEEGEGRGLGLVSMRERIESLGGRFEIRSNPGEGTRVTAQLHRTAGAPPEAPASPVILTQAGAERASSDRG